MQGVAATPTSRNSQLNNNDLVVVKRQYPLISLGILILECGTVSKTGQLSSAAASSVEKKQGEQETVIESQYQPFDLPRANRPLRAPLPATTYEATSGSDRQAGVMICLKVSAQALRVEPLLECSLCIDGKPIMC